MKRAGRGRWLGFAASGLLLYGVFLLAFAPAQYLAHGVAALGHGTVTLQQPSGTLWQGQGTLVLARPGAPTLPLQWNVRVWNVFLGSIDVEFRIDGSDTQAHGTLELGWRRYAVRDLVAAAPVTVVGQLYPAANLAGLTGRLRITTRSLEIDHETLQGSADVLWEGASSRLLPLNQTSDYKLSLAGQGKRAALRVSTVQGPLQVSGEGEWRLFEDKMLHFQGTVTPSTPQPALEPMLNALGSSQPDGRRAISFETRLAPF